MAWLGAWAKRIAITIDHTKVDADLVDFPVCIHLAAAAGISSDDVSAVFDELVSDANRKKIAVTTSDGTTQCYVEIEKWDTTNEQAFLHVKVPSVSSSADTTLYIYYDSTQSDNTSYVGDTNSAVAQNVWDGNFAAVWHFATVPSAGAVYDSTVNVNHGSPSSGWDASRLISGKCGGAYNTTSNKYISVPNKACLQIRDNITAEAVFYHISSTNWQALFNKGYSIPYGMKGNPRICWRINASSDIPIGSNYTYGEWHSFSGTYASSAGLMRLLVDGVFGGSHANSGLIDNNTYGITICSDSVYWYFNGYIDELRISNVVRSDAWMAATHNTLFDTLLTFAVEEIFSGSVLALEDAKLTLSAYYQDRDDLMLLLTNYGLSREDLETYFSATDGIVLEDFMSHLEAADYSIEDLKLLLSAYFQDSFDMKTFLSIWGWFRSDFKLYLYAEKIDYKDLLLALYVSKRNLSNLKTYLQAVDGVNVDVMLKLYLRAVSPVVTDSNLKVFLSVTKKIPLRIGSIYHRLTSVTTTIS